MQKLMGTKVDMPAPIWDKLNYSWAAFFALSGALNLYVAFSGAFTEAQWVNFKVFGLMALLLLFVIVQSIWLGKHMKEEQPQAVTETGEPKEGSDRKRTRLNSSH